MCWGGEASTTLAVAGFGVTAYLIKKGEKKELWLFLLYFSLMETLQAVTYGYIDQCGSTLNKFLTFLGYTHIAFQPFFINMTAMHFIPITIKKKIAKYVYVLCGVGAGMFVLKALPLGDAALCHVGAEGFCGPIACSYTGNWHVAWQWPLNNFSSSALVNMPIKEYITGAEAKNYMFKGNWTYAWQWLRDFLGTNPLPFIGLEAHHYLQGLHAQVYCLCAFILPMLYGAWRLIVVMFLLGPFLAHFFTTNVNEFPAVWCLFSIGLCCTIILSPIRQYLYVKHSFLYPYILRSKPERQLKMNRQE